MQIRQNVDCKAGVRSFNQMVFRNTTHMGSGFVIRTKTATLHQRLGLRWMIDAWENTVIFSETEPKPVRQVQEHKTISMNSQHQKALCEVLSEEQSCNQT